MKAAASDRLLHPVRDRDLPEPFRTWTERDVPLSESIALLPRTVSVSADAWSLTYLTIVCFAMAGSIAFGFTQGGPDVPVWAAACIAGLIAALITVPLGATRKLISTIAARRDQRTDRLRQGVLVGPDGILIRLQPNRCYAFSLNEFLRAEDRTESDDESTRHFIRIVFQSGTVEFPFDRLAVSSVAIHETVVRVRRNRR
jgi:hypothetical protein